VCSNRNTPGQQQQEQQQDDSASEDHRVAVRELLAASRVCGTE
jgi:hypothetical protein